MLYAAIDIHKDAFQAAVLDAESGQVVEERFSADRESLARWADGVLEGLRGFDDWAEVHQFLADEDKHPKHPGPAVP